MQKKEKYMIERFLKQTKFTSVEDYNKNLEFIIPEGFNFAYDVMDWPFCGPTTRVTRYAPPTES